MAIYNPDYKLIAAKKYVDSLEGIEAEHVNYLLKTKDDYIENLRKEIKEFREACAVIGKYIPSKGPTIYGKIR